MGAPGGVAVKNRVLTFVTTNDLYSFLEMFSGDWAFLPFSFSNGSLSDQGLEKCIISKTKYSN